MDKNKQDNHICRASLTPASDDSYDFSAIAVPSVNGQVRYSYENNEYYNQVLRTDEASINSERLDSGLPLFDNHPWDASATNQLGITVGYDFTPEGIVVRCKWGARADEALRNDVKNGIVKTVSIEGRIEKYSIKREIGQLPVYEAEYWTPDSLSFAPVPNDIAAQIDVQRAIKEQIQHTNIKPESLIKSITTKFKQK